ncbi:Transposase, type 1 [Cinara cedri]|uniref:Transposase, type 1 n=1 Tax=Cinara cedri TaxID=506608 RepID=A0A5E4NI66_9HEMI|nr:Transposase, type 1 [Cinara cedri]
MERSKLHFRHLLLLMFDLKKSAAKTYQTLLKAYGDAASSYPKYRFWFQRFKNGNFNVNDKERGPKKFEDGELQALLDENSAQTLKELSNNLEVYESTVSRRLYPMGKIQKEGKWLPHELFENAISNRFNIVVSLLARQKKKCKKSWVNPGEPSTSTPKRNIHGHKVLLCIWWDQQSIVYYELLKPSETVTADARPHVAKVVKDTLLQLEWEVLPYPAYSPDIAPSNYHLLRSMQHGLVGT